MFNIMCSWTTRRQFLAAVGPALASFKPNHSVQAKTELLGVSLGAASANLLKRIEVRCGKNLQVVQREYDFNIAEAGLKQDGTPTIAVAPGTVLTEELIVHELSHLELCIEGFPKLELNGLPDLHTFIHSDVLDVVQHRIFYPRLRRSGFVPEAARIVEARNLIAKGDFAFRLSTPDLAARYFRVLMETDDVPLGLEMGDWYSHRGWLEAKALAEEAFEYTYLLDLG